MKAACFAGGLFAIFMPPASSGPPPDFRALMAIGRLSSRLAQRLHSQRKFPESTAGVRLRCSEFPDTAHHFEC
jgi:hypothetical protein